MMVAHSIDARYDEDVDPRIHVAMFNERGEAIARVYLDASNASFLIDAIETALWNHEKLTEICSHKA